MGDHYCFLYFVSRKVEQYAPLDVSGATVSSKAMFSEISGIV